MAPSDSLNAEQIIGNTVADPGSVTPLTESQCRIAIPLPNFFLVGGAKCGSTTVTSMLSRHPDCCHSIPKETNFFTLNFDQGWDWYRGAFSHYDGEPVIGEGSVSYTGFPFRKNVVADLHRYCPDAKILFIVRNPYDKLVSGWKMALTGPGYLGHRSAKKGFETYVLHEEDRYHDDSPWENETHGWEKASPSSAIRTRVWLDALHYQGHIDSYRHYFSENQIKVMFLEEWRDDPLRQARDLCEFLALDPDKLPAEDLSVTNQATERKQTLPLFKFVADSSLLAPVRRMFPKTLRLSIRSAWYRSRFGSRVIKYPPLTMSDEFRRELLGYLEAKSRPFLNNQGKPPSFWDLKCPQ